MTILAGLLRPFAVFFVALLLAAPAAAQIAAPAAPAAEDSAKTTPDEAAAKLLEVLKDDAARAALIEKLEAGGAAAAPEAAPEAPPPLGRQIAEASTAALSAALDRIETVGRQLARAPSAFQALSLTEMDFLLQALLDLGLVILVTTSIFYLLRARARRLYRRIGAAAAGQGILRIAGAILLSVLIDAALVAVSWAAGYAAALAFAGETGAVAVREALYLNAFLAVGLVRVVIRAVLSPSAPELRLIHMPDKGAAVLSLHLSLIASIIGYGQLLITPVVMAQVGWAAGGATSTLLALVALALAFWLVLRGRKPVAEWLSTRPDGTERAGALRFLAAAWHIPALLWLMAITIVVVTRPGGLIWPVLTRSGEVLAAMVAGFVVSGALTKAIARGVSVPESTRLRLPLLETRLNAFVPKALAVARAFIVLAVAAFTLDATGLLDVGGWLSGERGARLSSGLVSVALILVLAFAVWVAFASWVDYRLNPDFGTAPTSREKTLLSLLRNAATIAVIIFSAMFALSELGVNIAPLIASAGVLGLAIGFGAQKLVQDVITGVFIQLENAMNVGDVVSLNGTAGVVEKLTIRSVSLRDVEGSFHIIPFSSVDMVSNFTRDFSFHVADMGVAYREDVSEAKQAMFDAFDELLKDPEHARNVLEPLQWFGLQALADSAVVLRARIKCAPGSQWGIGRAYNEICKRVFDERGIEIPFPHQTIYFGVDKKGEAPPLHIQAEPREPEPAPVPYGDGATRAAAPGKYDAPDSDQSSAEEAEGSVPR